MVVPGFDLEGIDWKNSDINMLFVVLSKQFDQMDQEMKNLKKENHRVAEENRRVAAENDQLRSKIDELTKTVEELKNKRGRGKKARSYNTRKFKGYP